MERAPTLFVASKANPEVYDIETRLTLLALAEQASDRIDISQLRDRNLAGASFVEKVMVGRLLQVQPSQSFSISAILYAISCCTRPGDAVLWAYTLCEEGRKLDRPVTVGDLLNAFPLGYPSDVARCEIWDRQKLPRDEQVGIGDNWLDTKEAWVQA